jgi:hypothetical protein
MMKTSIETGRAPVALQFEEISASERRQLAAVENLPQKLTRAMEWPLRVDGSGE